MMKTSKHIFFSCLNRLVLMLMNELKLKQRKINMWQSVLILLLSTFALQAVPYTLPLKPMNLFYHVQNGNCGYNFQQACNIDYCDTTTDFIVTASCNCYPLYNENRIGLSSIRNDLKFYAWNVMELSLTFASPVSNSNPMSEPYYSHHSNLTIANYTTLSGNAFFNCTNCFYLLKKEYPDGSSLKGYMRILVNPSNTDLYFTIYEATSFPKYCKTVNDSVYCGSNYVLPDGSVLTQLHGDTSVYTKLTATNDGCDSIVISNIKMRPVIEYTIHDTICYGGSYTFPDGSSSPHTHYAINHTSYFPNASACDSIVHTQLIVTYDINAHDSVTICKGASYTFKDGYTINNATLTTNHVSTLHSTTSCDTILETHLEIQTPPIFRDTICSGSSFTFLDGYTSTNIIHPFTRETPYSNPPCNYILNYIYIKPSTTLNELISVCPSSSYTFIDGTVFPNIIQDTFHFSIFTNQYGCDSSIKTTIHVYPTYLTDVFDTICYGAPYTFPDGVTIASIVQDTIHQSWLTDLLGCDSLVTSHIHLIPYYSIQTHDSICSGSSYTFPDGITILNIPLDTTHMSSLMSISGCDSIVTTHVHILSNYATQAYDSICYGSLYTFPDSTLVLNIQQDTTHISEIASQTGCDSIVTTFIHVLPKYAKQTYDSICSGSSYLFPDSSLMMNIQRDTTYVSELTSHTGCDSIVTSFIHVMPISNTINYDTVCKDATYHLPNGQEVMISTDTVFLFTEKNIHGCDSLIALHLISDTLSAEVLVTSNTLKAIQNGPEISWMDCTSGSILNNEHRAELNAKLDGMYALILSNQSCRDTSDCYSIGQDLNQFFIIYPTISEQTIKVETRRSDLSNLFFEIFDNKGMRILKQAWPRSNKLILDVSNLAKGVYLFRLDFETQRFIVR